MEQHYADYSNLEKIILARNTPQKIEPQIDIRLGSIK